MFLLTGPITSGVDKFIHHLLETGELLRLYII